MAEIRCKNCGKLLGTTDSSGFEIAVKCPRCQHMYKYKVEVLETQS